MKNRNQANLLFLAFSMMIVTLLSLGCGGEKSGETVSGPKINFVMGYEEAMATAKANNQPVLIDFYTDWCRWCKVLDTVTYVDSAVIELSNRLFLPKSTPK